MERKLTEKCVVGRRQVNDIIKNNIELKKLFDDGSKSKQKRKFTKTEGLMIDDVVYNWFCKVINKELLIAGPLIKEKALEVATDLKIDVLKHLMAC